LQLAVAAGEDAVEVVAGTPCRGRAQRPVAGNCRCSIEAEGPAEDGSGGALPRADGEVVSLQLLRGEHGLSVAAGEAEQHADQILVQPWVADVDIGDGAATGTRYGITDLDQGLDRFAGLLDEDGPGE